MSIVIKSNSVYTGADTLATVEQVLTTPQEVISNFQARVVADGGQIVSMSKLESAVNFLFDNNLYGRMGVCASPHYAVKLDVTGGVEKLYSIDGQDLVGLTLGGGTLPKVTEDNFVNFNDGVSGDTIGGILTTANKQAWSETGRFAVAVATKNIMNSGLSPIFGMSTHGETSLNSDVFSLLTNTSNGGNLATRINNNTYGGTFAGSTVTTINSPKNGGILFSYDKFGSKAEVRIHGGVLASVNSLIAPQEVYRNEHYLDFGGTSRSVLKIVSGVKMAAMWFVKDLRDIQASEINKFHEAEYL